MALFGLPAAAAHATTDVALCLAGAPAWRRESFAGATVRYRTPAGETRPDDSLIVYEFVEGFCFRYADATEFHIARDGHEIFGTWAASSTLADAETYLLGPVLGFAQRLMGVLCLHASAVVVDDMAIALCGPAYAGKSTTAGAFAAAGYGVLADDMTSIRERDGHARAMPAYDHLRVWKESERILLGTSGALPRLTPTWEKLALTLRAQGWTFRDEPARLGAVVLLAPRGAREAEPLVEPVTARDAFVEMAANSYANYLLDDPMRAREFASIARLMASVRVFRAVPSGDSARLGALVHEIVGAVRA